LELLLQGHCAGRYEASAFVLMANHVHLLLRPAGNLSAAMQWIKGASARAANLVLSTSGRAFWQRESYDRLVRDSEEFERIAHYIERNPVKAGLVGSPEEWKWSSANPEVWVRFLRA
jgi:putative transposase